MIQESYNIPSYQAFEDGIIDGILLGDSGYPLKPWLLTPFLNPTTPAQRNYNAAHCSTRNTVERAFGVLKRRFHCLHGELRMIPQSVQHCLFGCCSAQHSKVGSRGQQPKQGSPDFPFPSYFVQLFLGDPDAFPGQPRDIVSPACPGSSLGSPTSGTCPEHLTREASGRHPN
ncbi:putative nuclease HARBI1 [Merluccius polli]|uniref:Nuclease HARBI1 n=1 Tax=Merluccius polli TaxID=89951 RepID=A0AA47P5E7_MERPO|nr:putative nuclease HARBI1 [Merluccius polli]